MKFTHSFRLNYDEATGEVSGEHRCTTDAFGDPVSYAESVKMSKADAKELFVGLIDGPTREEEIVEDDPDHPVAVKDEDGNVVGSATGRRKATRTVNNRLLMEEMTKYAAAEHAAAVARKARAGVRQVKLTGAVGASGQSDAKRAPRGKG